MKRNELTQIKGLSLTELREKAKSQRKEIADLIMEKNMKKIKNVKMVSKKRKDLAQILTIMRQKQLLEKLELLEKGGNETKVVMDPSVNSGQAK